jgi:uncharacterized membrane protein (UPF0127 family)
MRTHGVPPNFLIVVTTVVVIGAVGVWLWFQIEGGEEEISSDYVSEHAHTTSAQSSTSEPARIAATTSVRTLYEPLAPMQIDGVAVQASVAYTPTERSQGLSDTPALPRDIVKLFVFPESKKWGFWMKDMNYPIDILWLDQSASIVHIEEQVMPSSYPNSYTPEKPARYVIETAAGFVAEHAITTGATVDLPALP